jgi:recombination protein RecR
MLPTPIQDLSDKLRYFPGIGSRSSQKLALDVMHLSDEKFGELVVALADAREKVGFCPKCGFFSETENLCAICTNTTRNIMQICLVEKPTDVITMERGQIYRGYYHVLNHLISPLDNIFAENTTVGRLFDVRLSGLFGEGLKGGKNVELILFFKAGFASEATTAYIKERITESGFADRIKITRLATGLPLYYNPDTLDQATMARALEDRREVLY